MQVKLRKYYQLCADNGLISKGGSKQASQKEVRKMEAQKFGGENSENVKK